MIKAVICFMFEMWKNFWNIAYWNNFFNGPVYICSYIPGTKYIGGI